MKKRLILCQITILAMAMMSLPVSQAQTFTIPDRSDNKRPIPTPTPMRISSYENDPFVAESLVRRMDAARFSVDEEGRPVLQSNLVSLGEESKIYRQDPQTKVFKPFAWNPWPVYPTANQQGDFRFPDEERFPLHTVERDADGKIILRDGLQVWTPRTHLRLGSTTVYEAAHAAKDAAESWAGRNILWGENGQLFIEPHVFIDFNAFYSPITRSLHFGVVPYRLPGQTDVKMFETATSWDMVAHECGHALHNTLKPNHVLADKGFDFWGESFGDQTAMWTSLRNPDRVSRLLDETNGDEAATPHLRLSRLPRRSGSNVEELLQANLDRLGIGPDFGLKLQSVTLDERFGETIVRVQLTLGRGDGATPLDNHGILVFRKNGALADYHAPLTPNAPLQARELMTQAEQIRPLIVRAKQLRLDQLDAPLSIARRPDGRLTVETRVMRGEGLDAYLEVFTLDNPQGERREILIPPVPPDKRIPIPDDIIN